LHLRDGRNNGVRMFNWPVVLSMIRYIELKSGYHDDGPAWIARVAVSKSGRTLYFNGKALKRGTQSGSGNYYDVETTESYWLSGVKKKGGDRHWAGRGKITIDAGAIDEYLQITGATALAPSRFVVSTAIMPPDTKKFHDLENQPLTPPDGSV
jgi:hypothetical protein